MRGKAVAKRALVMSVFSMLMCIAMLAGSTFAWFTDSATGTSNEIIAGNLDVELQHKVGDEYVDVTKTTKLFDIDLWEPGAVYCETLRVSNEGTLALKYLLSMVTLNVNYVVEADGTVTERSLRDVLSIAIVDGEVDPADRAAALEIATFVNIADFDGKTGKLVPNGDELKAGFTAEDTFTVVLYWEPNVVVDDNYNLKNGAYASDSAKEEVGALSIDLRLTLVATQVPYEADSFDETYDEDAQYPVLETAQELVKDLRTVLKNNMDRPESFLYNLTFCEYDESLGLGEWETGICVDEIKGGAIRLFSNDRNSAYICVQPGTKIMLNKDCADMFSGYSNLKTIDFGPKGLVSTADVESMANMFSNCAKLVSVNISGWDVSSVTDMHSMFYNCKNLVSLDLSGWDASAVENMNSMFYNCVGLTELNLSGWKVSSVTDLDTMFYQCSSLVSLDLSGWDVSKVTTTYRMFRGCQNLTELDLSGWEVSSVTNMGEMFNLCAALRTIYAGDWNVPTGCASKNMFNGCTSLPNYNSGQKNHNSAKTIENGGYFTAK